MFGVESNYRPSDYKDFPTLPEGYRWERRMSGGGFPNIVLSKKARRGWRTVGDRIFTGVWSEAETARRILEEKDFHKKFSQAPKVVE